MKIAIASEGETAESEISSKGGRAPYYLIFEKSEVVEVVKNPFASGSGGAGFSVAYMLADKDVKLMVAEKVGGNMISALKERGVEFREGSGKIDKILKELD